MGRTTAVESLEHTYDPLTQYGEKEWTQRRVRLQQQSAGAFARHPSQQSIHSHPPPNYTSTAPVASDETKAQSGSTRVSAADTASTPYTTFQTLSVAQSPRCSSAATAAEYSETQPFPSSVTCFRGTVIPTIVVLPDMESVPPHAGALAGDPPTPANVASTEVTLPTTPRKRPQTSSQEGYENTDAVVIDEGEGEIAAESTAGGCVGSVAREVICFFFPGGGAAAACARDTLGIRTSCCRSGCRIPVIATEGCQNAAHNSSSSSSDNDGLNTHDTRVKDFSVCGSRLNNWCAPSMVCSNSSTKVLDQMHSCSCSFSEGAARSPSPLEHSPTGGDVADRGGGGLPCSTTTAPAARHNALAGYVRGCAKQVCALLSRDSPAGAFSSRVTSERDTQATGNKVERHSRQDSNSSIPANLSTDSTASSTQLSTVAAITTDSAEEPVTTGVDNCDHKEGFSASVQKYMWSCVRIFSHCSELVATRRCSRTTEGFRALQSADEGDKPRRHKSKSYAFAACEEEVFNGDSGSNTGTGSCCAMTKKALFCCRVAARKSVATVSAGAAWVKIGRARILPAVTAVSQLGGCYTEHHHIVGDSEGETPERRSCPVCGRLDFADVPLLS